VIVGLTISIGQAKAEYRVHVGDVLDVRIDLLRELQDANVKLEEIRAKLQSVGEKLQSDTGY
jgi:polysaccharide export outer membrane protein